MKKFKKNIEKRSDRLDTNLVFALDLSSPLYELSPEKRSEKRSQLYEDCLEILNSASRHLAGVKINYPLVLALGLDLTSKLLREVDLPAIGDFKVADIDNTCSWIGRHAYASGFDALIAHAFVGYEGGLDGLFEQAEKFNKGVILVINMSHPGSGEFITPRAEDLAHFAVDRGADGVIAPATRPEEVEIARKWVGEELLMLTPGIGAQGGEPGDAIGAGADLEIVGRAIYQADDPAASAGELKEKMNR